MKKLVSFLGSKIRIKLILTICAVIVFFIAVILLTSKPLLFRAFTKSTYNHLVSTANTIDYYNPDSSGYFFDLYYISTGNNVDFELADSDGMLIYTSEGEGSPLSSSHFPSSGNDRPEYESMQKSDTKMSTYNYEDFEIKRKTATDADYFIYHRQLLSGQTVYIYTPVANVENVVSVAQRVYSFFAIAMFILIGIVFCLISSGFTKPLEEMNDVTGDMAKLNFDRKCKDYGRDEIGELGKSINSLSTALDFALMDLKDKNRQLEKDIELRRDLDNARKSFISNVSHELKTPIAIISGYAEGLYEGISNDPQVIRDYCGVIKDESEKMNELVLELLELSKLESKTRPFKPDYFDIGDMITSLISHLSIQLSDAGVTVTNNVPDSLICYAESEKIELVLKNYITNAISHCEGEKKIIIGSEKDDKTIRISVFNTGNHIAEDDLSGIWDSFYRADKSHGRSQNRFGLGLSIVKSIMENHKCSYEAKNKEKGVEFTFTVAEDKSYYEANEG